MEKHAAALERLHAQLASGPSAPSKLEREWQGDVEAVKIRLQKQRESAVERWDSCAHVAEAAMGGRGEIKDDTVPRSKC